MGEIPSRPINGSDDKGLTFKLMERWKSLQVYSQVIKKVGRSLSRKQLHKFHPEITRKLEGNENHTNEEKLVNTLSAKTKECNLVTCLVDC
jgi:hypothetical protein